MTLPYRPVHWAAILALVFAWLLPVAPAALAQDAANDTATIHYFRSGSDYAGWGLHVGPDAAQETTWDAPLAPTGSDDFGVYWDVPLRAGAAQLRFILHNGEDKDPRADLVLDLSQSRQAWIVHGSPEVYLTQVDPAEVFAGLPVAPEPAPAADTAPPQSVSFPGDYAPVLGGVAWQPADPTVQGADEDGDGVWTLTADLPAGSYEFKVAIDGAWDENYGRDGVAGGDNVALVVPDGGGQVIFRYDQDSHAIDVEIGPPAETTDPAPVPGDGQFVRAAILHDSRSDLYRTPFGAQPLATEVTLRLRTAAGDVEQVNLVVTDLAANSDLLRPMAKAANDGTYDWWEATLNTGSALTVFSYRFALTDGDATLYYGDDAARDGGLGQTYTTPPAADAGWNIYAYLPGFDAPDWAKNAVIYQIFPDRFRNGDPSNDPTVDDWFYPDERGHAFPITPWNTIVPDPVPLDPQLNPEWYGTFSSTFYGGDLQGVQEKLDYLQSLGVDTIYFNPIFDSPSNHRYDGRDYRQVDEDLGIRGDAEATNRLFETLAAEVAARGMHLILDAVPNHTSSDSPLFDRFGRHATVGACEAEESPTRDWYFFQPAPDPGSGLCAGDANYRAWFNVATLPQVDTANEEVIANWLGADGIVDRWLKLPGVDGWRVDVVPDVVAVNPHFFELMRQSAKETKPDALLISETWPEDQARLRVLGDEFDSTMNYRFRNAVLGFLRDSEFTDNKGTLRPLTASEFDAAVRAIEEDYPPAAFATAMNLISSHDTNRAVYVLDHDGVDAGRTQPVNGFADGRRRLALAAALLMTLPGVPTIYYGDEVGLAGFGSDPLRDDPYNRQPYPWPDAAGYDALPTWRQQDASLLAEFQKLGQLRSRHSFLRTGSWDTLLTDDAGGLYVFGRKDDTGAAIVAVNRGEEAAPVKLSLGGYLPYGDNIERPLHRSHGDDRRPGCADLHRAGHELSDLADPGGRRPDCAHCTELCGRRGQRADRADHRRRRRRAALCRLPLAGRRRLSEDRHAAGRSAGDFHRSESCQRHAHLLPRDCHRAGRSGKRAERGPGADPAWHSGIGHRSRAGGHAAQAERRRAKP